VLAVALDAHRHEVYLRVEGPEEGAEEMLAGAAELAAIAAAPKTVAVGDDEAAALLKAAWPAVEQIRLAAPAASDALELAVARIATGEFVDLAQLDGHYLRRSDAEIFGDPIGAVPTGV
jgi:tRNA threonylcarbamoyladenosine biosynthesis protein TsaB